MSGEGDLDETKRTVINKHGREDGYSGAATVLSASVDVSKQKTKTNK